MVCPFKTYFYFSKIVYNFGADLLPEWFQQNKQFFLSKSKFLQQPHFRLSLNLSHNNPRFLHRKSSNIRVFWLQIALEKLYENSIWEVLSTIGNFNHQSVACFFVMQICYHVNHLLFHRLLYIYSCLLQENRCFVLH